MFTARSRSLEQEAAGEMRSDRVRNIIVCATTPEATNIAQIGHARSPPPKGNWYHERWDAIRLEAMPRLVIYVHKALIRSK